LGNAEFVNNMRIKQSVDMLVYLVLNDTVCTECAGNVPSGHFLFLENGKALCLSCADLDHLVYLESGNAALSRRAKKLSPMSAIVLRFSRTRKRYERQGILVTDQALEEAKRLCDQDKSTRDARRIKSKETSSSQDKKFLGEFLARILDLFPSCPASEARFVAEYATKRGSGRVGRIKAARELEPEPIRLAVRAYIRHAHTPYDSHLMKGVSRAEARMMVAEKVGKIIQKWEKEGRADET